MTIESETVRSLPLVLRPCESLPAASVRREVRVESLYAAHRDHWRILRSCADDAVPTALSVEQMAGVFLLQAAGCVAAIIWYALSHACGMAVLPAANIVMEHKPVGRSMDHPVGKAPRYGPPVGGEAPAVDNETDPINTVRAVRYMPWHAVRLRPAVYMTCVTAFCCCSMQMRRLLDLLQKERNVFP